MTGKKIIRRFPENRPDAEGELARRWVWIFSS